MNTGGWLDVLLKNNEYKRSAPFPNGEQWIQAVDSTCYWKTMSISDRRHSLRDNNRGRKERAESPWERSGRVRACGRQRSVRDRAEAFASFSVKKWGWYLRFGSLLPKCEDVLSVLLISKQKVTTSNAFCWFSAHAQRNVFIQKEFF